MRVRVELIAAAGLGLSPACQTADSGTSGAPSAAETQVVAEVYGQPVTAAELDEWIRQDLFERETRGGNPARLYELRKASLQRMIDERVVETESKRRNVPSEALIREEIEASGGVGDEEIEAFYEENKDRLAGATLESLTPRIRAFLESQRAGEVMERLRERAQVAVLLEPVRLRVAADGPSRGPADARVTIVEFSDFQCPFCKRAGPVLDEVMAKYPDDVRLVYRHLPLPSHSRARPAAEASVCAHDQGKFWVYHDLLFENARQLADEDLRRYAVEAGLDVARFEQCLLEPSTVDKVESDAAAAREVGINGTPAFLVNGVFISGAKPASEFIEVIEGELAREG